MGNQLTAFVDMLPGMIIMHGGSNDPLGWMTCDGRSISRTGYPKLFAVIGETYGAGNGSTTFNIPDLRGRVPINHGAAHDSISARSIGAVGGVEEVVLSEDQMPKHGHPWRSNIHTESSSESSLAGGFIISDAGTSEATEPAYTGAPSNTAGRQIGGTGNDEAHTNMPPYAVVNYIIKY